MSAMHLVSTLVLHTCTKLWPAGQALHTVHSSKLWCENLPCVHSLQSVASAPPLYVAGRQGSQDDALSESEYCPSVHDVQIVAIEAEYLPAGQFVHDELLVAVYCPFSHVKQKVAFESDHLPPGHHSQLDMIAPDEYLPPGHSVQELDSITWVLNNPAVQFEHCVA
jgi:hypothetical protein